MMKTVYHVIPELGSMRTIVCETLPTRPGYEQLRREIEPHLNGERLEHVSVFWEGARRDMFVGECSAINGRMIRNIRATKIYRNNWLDRHPEFDPESLPAISGPAVLFPHRRVWF